MSHPPKKLLDQVRDAICKTCFCPSCGKVHIKNVWLVIILTASISGVGL